LLRDFSLSSNYGPQTQEPNASQRICDTINCKCGKRWITEVFYNKTWPSWLIFDPTRAGHAQSNGA
jgi:hypothetical protein